MPLPTLTITTRIGKGGSIRTVLLDDRGHVTLLKLHLGRVDLVLGRADVLVK
ncbi:hypothetical protein ACQP2T_05395 [Nonomuraea sp. CA-143628]|uniref:hypothetical protein n=1 Tax=Nonomuraea sp. CA-143628 TaxID=3239997 RepID=UPI003D8BF61C